MLLLTLININYCVLHSPFQKTSSRSVLSMIFFSTSILHVHMKLFFPILLQYYYTNIKVVSLAVVRAIIGHLIALCPCSCLHHAYTSILYLLNRSWWIILVAVENISLPLRRGAQGNYLLVPTLNKEQQSPTIWQISNWTVQ